MQFSKVLGLSNIKEHLTASADVERVPHAQLFVGPEGCGGDFRFDRRGDRVSGGADRPVHRRASRRQGQLAIDGAIGRHFVAASTNHEAMDAFGIDPAEFVSA